MLKGFTEMNILVLLMMDV